MLVGSHTPRDDPDVRASDRRGRTVLASRSEVTDEEGAGDGQVYRARGWLRDGYEATRRGDVEALDATLSRAEGTVMIGTDPNGWWFGHEPIRAAFEEQVRGFGGGYPLRAGDPRAYVEGDVGWLTDRPSFELPDGTTVETRPTGVVHRGDEGWRWVQAHFSLGVPNEDAFAEVPLG